MTEKEAIRILGDTQLCSPLGQAAFRAIECIKELQQYRTIGTVEECRNAVEKQKSKKVFIIAASKIVCKGSYVFYKCPVCREQICSGFYYPPLDTYLGEKQYCENCGQAIDWSEEE